MSNSLKAALQWAALLALAAIVIGAIVYSVWALVALVVSCVCLLGAQDYDLIGRTRSIKVRGDN